ncbi:MAG TPA: DUF3416 domain-containing protein, partial [Cyclobacteriaceae bacterium]|nr:DUF3416 domain-containing protein [Cyclobacteriaceae bacterium]
MTKKKMSGQARVIIENVQPSVDGGLYPVKRTVGERVDVTANIFGDGHDHIRAELLFRHSDETNWNIIELKSELNDVWEASFPASVKGSYFFTVRAWVDHFDTWYDGIKKKAAANVDVSVELMEGAAYLNELVKENKNLQTWAKRMADRSQKEKLISEVLSEDFARIVHENPLRQHITSSGAELEVRVEHKKALYSTWYELFPRSSSLQSGRHGTFFDTIKLLPRVAAMNFDVLYLPPIHPIGKINRKGKNNTVKALPGEPGSPWAIGSDEGGHKSVHPELGTMDDYKKLIREAKKFDIDIAMDL